MSRNPEMTWHRSRKGPAMQYRKDKYGNDVSAIGYGCMRFTQTAGVIDIKKTEKELLRAIELGVNYFDTAYIYPGSEAALGEIFSRNSVRDRVKIATKLPQYLIKKPGDCEKYFSEELRRLKTDHVDYYLMHMLNDDLSWERIKALGIKEWLAAKKASGEIGQVGFSYHGNADTFIRLLDAEDWDFCQIQYNSLDENSQAGVTGLKAAAQKGIPVIIMEPLRGGRLANALPKKALSLFEDSGTPYSPAAMAFRWLWNQPEVTCVLSGMNSLEMLEENAKIASEALPGCLTEADLKLIEGVKNEINRNTVVPCTGCRYCMPCPAGVDIPGVFSALNRTKYDGKFQALREYTMGMAQRQNYTGAKNCIGCGKCEKHCPQEIPIRDMLKLARKKLEGPVYKIASKAMGLVMKY